MTLSIIFLMSVVCVAAALILLCRVIGLRRVLRHATVVDVVFTVVACLALAGTLTGVLIGIVAGLIMTGTLTVLKAVLVRLDALKADTDHADDWAPKYGWDKL